jgi:(2Fe-2S) ferredoxin
VADFGFGSVGFTIAVLKQRQIVTDKTAYVMTTTAHFEHHVFFCLNVREPIAGEAPRACCGGADAASAQQHAKKRIKGLGLNGSGKVRINQAGCLDRCEQGPCLVVYPQGTWYSYVDNADIDAIINEHIVGGQVVTRLEIPAAS